MALLPSPACSARAQKLGARNPSPYSLTGASGRLTGHIDHYVDADVGSVIRRLDPLTQARGVVSTGQRLYASHGAAVFSRFLKSTGSAAATGGLARRSAALFRSLPVLTHIKALDLRERADRHV
jgi:hypothetical protein